MAITLDNALAIISKFSLKNAETLSAKKDHPHTSDSLSNVLSGEFSKPIPTELAQYIDRICPNNGLCIQGVGHPVELLKPSELAWQPALLSELTGELGTWQDDWFLIAHEGGDPIIVKATEQAENSPVYSAMQGMGFWDFAPIADSIGQFLVCISAIQHALNFPGLNAPLDDDFNLAPAAANWLFPMLRQHAGTHYDEWASVFENYQLG